MINYSNAFWQRKVFAYILTATTLFVVLTIVAMFFYPGGSISDPTTQGYSFFRNAFSDLGSAHAWSGASNLFSGSLFLAAMTLAGLALVFFSTAFLQFFQNPGAERILAMCASIIGIATGLCFIGVGFARQDTMRYAHAQFANWGFRFFTISALFWAVSLFRHRTYPQRYAWVFVAFGALLAGYIFLPYIMFMILGPYSPERRALGFLILNTGQKIIVYAAIISVLIQACGARSVNRS